MVKFIEHNELLCNRQHGFVSGKSCLTQILSKFDDTYKGLLAGADTDAIYLDYAKAFDKVDQQLLLKNSVTMDLTKNLYPGLNPSLLNDTNK